MENQKVRNRKNKQNNLDQLAKPTFRSRYVHTPVTEQSEGPLWQSHL